VSNGRALKVGQLVSFLGPCFLFKVLLGGEFCSQLNIVTRLAISLLLLTMQITVGRTARFPRVVGLRELRGPIVPCSILPPLGACDEQLTEESETSDNLGDALTDSVGAFAPGEWRNYFTAAG
jgi:hypothetical protein